MCHRRANSSCKRSRLSSAVRHRRASNVTLIGVKLPCPSRAGLGVMHVVMLTLGFDWRGFYHGCADEPLAQFLEGHERVVAHCGGHTQQHLNDRVLTVWYSGETERGAWNPTGNAFGDYLDFELRVCRSYRARTKGKVKSGVKYPKRNFLLGRTLVDPVGFQGHLLDWAATILLRLDFEPIGLRVGADAGGHARYQDLPNNQMQAVDRL